MSEVGDAINEARTELAIATSEFMEDLCDLIKPTFQDGGTAGDTLTTGVIASNVPVNYRGARPGSQVVVGGEAYIASHELDMPRTVQTLVITPEYKIKVLARGDTAVITFQKPVIVHRGSDVLLTVAAELVQQGFQQ